jgi:hypothetical protein
VFVNKPSSITASSAVCVIAAAAGNGPLQHATAVVLSSASTPQAFRMSLSRVLSQQLLAQFTAGSSLALLLTLSLASHG